MVEETIASLVRGEIVLKRTLSLCRKAINRLQIGASIEVT